MKQVPAAVEMVMFDWLVEIVIEKDEWRFATMEYGGQCVTMAGMKVDANVVCQQVGFSYQRALPTNDSRFGDGKGPILLDNVACNQIHSNLFQCVNFQYIGTFRYCMHTAGVICEGMNSTSTKQIPANMSHDSTYASHDSTPTASNSTVVAILVSVGALVIMVAIAVITIVLITRLRLKANR
jgi:hypothetical protein